MRNGSPPICWAGEHDTAAQSILITDDAKLAPRSSGGRGELASLPRAASGRLVARLRAVILVKNLARRSAVDASRPSISRSWRATPRGSRRDPQHRRDLLGPHTPEAIGDYVAGSNHVLRRRARRVFSSGLGVLDFMKRTSILRCGADQLRRARPAAIAAGGSRGPQRHARSVAIRLTR